MSFDFLTLVTNRNQNDVDARNSKGTYNATDLNRVTAAMEELDQQFRQYGYSTGYQRIEIPHGGNQGVTYLEYIESSGTQYIDTGHKPTNNSRVVMEVEALKGGVYPFFGARTANGVGSFVLWEMSASSIRSDFNTTGTETTVSKVLSHVVIDKNKNVCKFGDTTITSGAASFNCSYNLCLLALNSGGEVDERKLSAKLYRCQVYDNDTLIHDFRPALDGDGIACLRDEVSKTFYHNTGTGKFKAGPLFTIQRLEYIESSGTQYIDSGISIERELFPTIGVSADVEINHTPGLWSVSGCGGGHPVFYFGCSQNNKFAYGNGQADVETEFSYINGRHNFGLDVPGKKFVVDDLVSIQNISFLSPNAAGNFYISAYRNPNNSASCHAEKIYSYKFYDGDVLIRDFIPAKNGSGAVGLYDLINRVFYENAGTGEFISGPQIGSDSGEEEEKDPYTWYEDDIPTVELMEKYLANVSALRSTIDLLSTTPEAPESMELLTYIEANNIEQILLDIESLITAMSKIFLRSGMAWAISNGPGFYFSN